MIPNFQQYINYQWDSCSWGQMQFGQSFEKPYLVRFFTYQPEYRQTFDSDSGTASNSGYLVRFFSYQPGYRQTFDDDSGTASGV